MGRIADAIEQVETDLEEALEAIEEFRERVCGLEAELDSVMKDRDNAWKQVEEHEEYLAWVEANYPDAPAIYGALEKLKK